MSEENIKEVKNVAELLLMALNGEMGENDSYSWYKEDKTLARYELRAFISGGWFVVKCYDVSGRFSGKHLEVLMNNASIEYTKN